MTDSNSQAGPLQRVFGCDVRSLALFRIAMGITIIADLILRWSSMVGMYTDKGFFTRQVAYDFYLNRFGEGWENVFWSLHWLSGSLQFQILLFIVAGVFALLLTLGLFTRVATVACWVLIVSLQVRNPVILSSGDFLLKLMLFWSMFVPLGKIWSLDAWRAGRTLADVPRTITSFATAGLIIQLFAMYFFTGIAKCNDIWFSGDAMFYVLRLDIYITEFGRTLLEYPGLLKLTSWATLFVEVILLCFLFVPWKTGWWRMINLVVYWAFHIGIAMAMTIGLFPIISMMAWLMLVPGGVWDWLGIRGGETTAIQTEDIPDQTWSIGRIAHVGGQTVCALLIPFILIWNVSNIDVPQLRSLRTNWMQRIGFSLSLNQHFQMFGHPPKTSIWYVYEGTLADGTTIDPFRNAPVVHERPEWVRLTFPSHHWRRVHRNMVEPEFQTLRQPMVDYLVRDWNERHPKEQRLTKLRMLFYFQNTGPEYDEDSQASVVFGSYRDYNEPGSIFDKFSEDMGDDLDGLPF